MSGRTIEFCAYSSADVELLPMHKTAGHNKDGVSATPGVLPPDSCLYPRGVLERTVRCGSTYLHEPITVQVLEHQLSPTTVALPLTCKTGARASHRERQRERVPREGTLTQEPCDTQDQ